VKFSNRLIAGTLAVVGLLVVVLVVLIGRQFGERVRRDTIEDLAREARFVGLRWTPEADPQRLAHDAGTTLRRRVTLVDSSGTVVGDSDFDAPSLRLLENHSGRPEIVAARAGEVGVALRRSPSRGDDELYVAVAAGRGVARVSFGVQALDALVSGTQRQVAVSGLIAMALALLLAWWLARSISRPVVELRDVAPALAAGHPTPPPAAPATGGVEELGQALRQLAEQLGRRVDALRNDETMLGQLTEALDQGVVTLDPKLAVVRINETGRRLLGVRDPVPFPFDQLPRKRELRVAVQLALRGQSTDQFELTFEQRTCNVTVRPLVGQGVVIAFIDLTRLRRLEMVRRDFVGNVSHELRTPLTVISGFAETLLHSDVSPEARHGFAERIVSHTRRMQRLVDDLLDLSRIESGGWTPEPAMLSIGAVADEAVSSARDSADTKGVTLSVTLGEGAETVWADATAVRQVLANLVENAIRHTVKGSVVIFSERADAGAVSIGVRDSGTGIPPEHVPRIFERFYRVDPGRSREQGGTGLGLAIVKHLVDAHGGSVRAQSQLGFGTTVWATFPGAGAAAAPT